VPCLVDGQLRLLPAQPSLALATFMPSRVRMRISPPQTPRPWPTR
jgi:hypothetical protein